MAEFDACVSWSFDNDEYDNDYKDEEQNSISNYECCLFTLPTIVKNCGDFRVYHIGPTQACSIAYCSAPVSTDFNNTYTWLSKALRGSKTTLQNTVCKLLHYESIS